jgi:hypothetical protein
MKKIIISFMIIGFLNSCNQSKTNSLVENSKIVIDLKKIAGKSKSEVEKILGKAERVETFSANRTPCKKVPCDMVFYKKNKFEIGYINNKADWITVNGLSEYDFNNDSIELFGLSKVEPSFNNAQSVIRWENLENINEISIFNNGSDKIDYAYIKVATE